MKHRLAAILAADAAGYSRLMADDERATVDALDAARTIFREHTESSQGRIVDTAGDSVLAIFETAAGALAAAVAIQQRLGTRAADAREERRLPFRIGIHVGDVIEKSDGTIYGDGVNVGARLQALAAPGGIVVSSTARDAVRDRATVSFEDLGEQNFKNIDRPIRAYRVAGAQGAVRAPLTPTSHRPSIAVLAFDNMSGDPDQEFFCDGISEDIITDLSKITGLAVIGRQSAFAYKGRATDLRTVGRELGVRYVLEGSVRKVGTRVRVTAQLIEAETGTHVWANRYDHDLDDVFLVGDAVVQDIVEALDIRLARGEDARIWRRALKTVKAREAFLRGWSAYYESTPDGARRARELFLEVTRLEPESSIGYAYVGLTHAIEVMQGWSADPGRSLDEARRQAEKAIALDPSAAGGHGTKSIVSLFEGNVDAAIADAQRSMDNRPMCASPRAGLAYVQLYAGDYQHAIHNARSAIDLNPVYPAWYLYLMAAAQHFGGHHAEALTTVGGVLTRNPKHVFARTVRISALAALGRLEEARTEAQGLLRDWPDFSVDRFIATQPFRDPAQRRYYADALRASGLP